MPARLLAVISAFLFLGLGLAASLGNPPTALSNGKTEEIVEASNAAPPAPADRLVVISSSRLTLPALAGAGPLRRDPLLKPTALCNTIQVGLAPTGWLESAVYPGEWECLSMAESPASDTEESRRKKLEPTLEKEIPEGVSLFAMARGTGKEMVSYVRFKVSGSSEAAADSGADVLADRVELLFRALNWSLPERVPLSIRVLQPFELDAGGTKIRLAKEVMADWRYNLIITFPARKGVPVPDDYRSLSPVSPPRLPTP